MAVDKIKTKKCNIKLADITSIGTSDTENLQVFFAFNRKNDNACQCLVKVSLTLKISIHLFKIKDNFYFEKGVVCSQLHIYIRR